MKALWGGGGGGGEAASQREERGEESEAWEGGERVGSGLIDWLVKLGR